MDEIPGIDKKTLQSNQSALLRREADQLRKELLEKKRIIESIEKEASQLDDLQICLSGLIRSFQENKNIGTFRDIDPSLLAHKSCNELINLIRNATEELASLHQNLENRFEIEFNRNVFIGNNKVAKAKVALQSEVEIIGLLILERTQKSQLLSMVMREKNVLQKTIQMRTQTLKGNQEFAEKYKNSLTEYLLKAEHTFENAKKSLQNVESEQRVIKENIDAIKEIKNREKMHLNELSEELLELQSSIKKESYYHSCLQSDLDKAKEELDMVVSTNNSFSNNVRSHDLMDAEQENRRLHKVLINERKSLERKLNVHKKKTAELEKVCAQLSQTVSELNNQVSFNEQKMQTMTLRIPDFGQLHQALEKIQLQARKNKEDTLNTQYMLDDIREKNRMMEQMEYNESKIRTAQLLSSIPLPESRDDEKTQEEYELMIQIEKEIEVRSKA